MGRDGHHRETLLLQSTAIALPKFVMPGLDPGIRFDWALLLSCGPIPGSSPGMTTCKMPYAIAFPLKGEEALHRGQ